MVRSALLLINVINDYLTPEGKHFIGEDAEWIVANLESELTLARRSNIPVFYINDYQEFSNEEFSFGVLYHKQTFGPQIVDELSPVANEMLLYKKGLAAFDETLLHAHLKKLDINHLIVAGVSTDTGILFTAYEAKKLGFNVSIIEDCVATSERMYHTYALRLLRDVLDIEIL